MRCFETGSALLSAEKLLSSSGHSCGVAPGFLSRLKASSIVGRSTGVAGLFSAEELKRRLQFAVLDSLEMTNEVLA